MSFATLAASALLQGQGHVRYFYAYGDAQTVALALGSGSDPLAAIGREIPAGKLFRVPANGDFKVQLMANVTGAAGWILGTIQGCNLVFDRTLAVNGSVNPPLGDTSSRKVSYAVATSGVYSIELKNNFSNFPTVPLYNRNDQQLDTDGDGVQDTGPLQVAGPSVVRGAWRNPDILVDREVGIGATLQNLDGNFRIHDGEVFRFADVSFHSNMIIGQTFGLTSEETGLQIFTAGLVDGIANSTARSTRVRNADSFEGARYNLLAVPEPSSLGALLLAMGILRRRK